MSLYEEIIRQKAKIAIVGLGYVGLPVAVEFAKYARVIGFDVDKFVISSYKSGDDLTNEVGNDTVKNSTVEWTFDEKKIATAKFIIVAVPTPVNPDTTPDLTMLTSACEIVGRNLAEKVIVVFESSVYPGVTEEICIPAIEKASGKKCGSDFFVGYSPERINPGDKEHNLKNITKIVSGIDRATTDEIASIYGIVVKAGIYKSSSIKVAEAAKVIENSQRDINIAFMNEIAVIFHKIGIDTSEVLDAAKTKWNFLPFTPGLVGGHCIGVDPYYLTYCADKAGYHSQVILSGRIINDGVGKYVAQQTINLLEKAGKSLSTVKVGCLGITFKENCRDVRNSKVNDIIVELNKSGITPLVWDPIANAETVRRLYGVKLVPFESLCELDCIIIAVAHDAISQLSDKSIAGMFKNVSDNKKVLIDVKGLLDKQKWIDYNYWRL